MFRGDAFGMKLPAMRGKPLVRKPHDKTIGLRRHRQDIRHGVAAHDKRMVASRPERAIEAAKNRFALVFNRCELAMHGFWRADDLAAKGLADRLMAEADPENWDDGPRVLDKFEADPGVARPAGAGRQHDRVGRRRHDFANAHFVIAKHRDVRAERAQAMHQVPGETVVIVDQRYGGHARSLSSGRMFWAARASRSRLIAGNGAQSRKDSLEPLHGPRFALAAKRTAS